MQLGLSSYTFGWAIGTSDARPAGAPGAIDLVRLARDWGVRVVQLCDNLPDSTWDDANVDALAAGAAESGVSVEVGTRGCSPEHLRRFIRVAGALKSPVLRVVLDTPGDHPDEAEVVRRVRAAAPELERKGVTLAIENHDRFSSAALAGIVRALRPAPVGVCLDTANSFGAAEGPRVVVETLGPYAVNFHLKDFAVVRVPYLQGFTIEGRPAGEGMLDAKWVLSRLKEFGYDGSAILELWVPPEAEPAATIRKEAEWAERSVRNARAWVAG